MILSGADDILVAAEASNGEEALDKLRTDNFDVLVLDIPMPMKSGLEVLKELKTRRYKISILMISAYATEEYGKRVIKEGADGFLSKEDAPAKLIDAIRKVVQNK